MLHTFHLAWGCCAGRLRCVVCLRHSKVRCCNVVAAERLYLADACTVFELMLLGRGALTQAGSVVV